MQPLQCHLETVTIIRNLILNQPPLPNKLSVFTFSSLSDHYGFVDWARNTEMPAVNSKSNTTSHDVVSIRLQLETNLKAKEHFGGGRECRGNRCNGSVDTSLWWSWHPWTVQRSECLHVELRGIWKNKTWSRALCVHVCVCVYYMWAATLGGF